MKVAQKVTVGISDRNLVWSKSNGYHDNVVSLYDNGNVLRENTHYKNIIDHEISRVELMKLPLIDIQDNIFLLYSNSYFVNFQHLLVELMPKITAYLECLSENKNIKLAVPHQCINKLTKELLDLIGINEKDIIILENGRYNIKYLYYCDYQIVFALPIYKEQQNFWEKIRGKIEYKRDNKKGKLVYLRRNDNINHEMNNNKAGHNRYIVNQKEFDDLLKKYDFKDLYMGNMNIKEKTDSLINIDILISEYGANLMNLLFAPYSPKFIILVGNERWGQFGYYTSLFDCWFKDNDYIAKGFNFPCKESLTDSTGNVPYIIDIKEIEDYINLLVEMY